MNQLAFMGIGLDTFDTHAIRCLKINHIRLLFLLKGRAAQISAFTLAFLLLGILGTGEIALVTTCVNNT